MSEKFTHLIADTSAFIKNKALQEIADNVYTVNEVMREVKNKGQIRRLVTLPYDLQVKDPDPENVKFIIDFAKKTGDYLSLSSIDIKIIALTYQFEKNFVGVDHLKTEPVKTTTIYSKEKPVELIGNANIAGFYNPQSDDTQVESEENPVSNGSVNSSDNEEIYSDEDDKDENIDSIELSIVQDLENLNVSNENLNEILPTANRKTENPQNKDVDQNSDDEEEDEDYEEDDDEGWITPGNIIEVKKSFGVDVERVPRTPVACMSSDYAIQNVLKQIGLNVAAIDGQVIKEMRTYILRCYACFKTTSIMTKIFCPNCGNKTLKRVAVSLDENGKQVVHVNLRRPLTAKGKNKSIPRPQGGKHSCNPILCEDQPIPKQMPTRVARTKTDALDEDYIAGYSPFVTRDIDSKSAVLRGKGNLKQLINNNAYANIRRCMKK